MDARNCVWGFTLEISILGFVVNQDRIKANIGKGGVQLVTPLEMKWLSI